MSQTVTFNVTVLESEETILRTAKGVANELVAEAAQGSDMLIPLVQVYQHFLFCFWPLSLQCLPIPSAALLSHLTLLPCHSRCAVLHEGCNFRAPWRAI